jgi:NAD(P)-dependent dehydrogenase (short-subunit alcohol dehydrogenase family)
MSSILVTGGAGYIGSHTCKALRRAGFDPVAYDMVDAVPPGSCSATAQPQPCEPGAVLLCNFLVESRYSSKILP